MYLMHLYYFQTDNVPCCAPCCAQALGHANCHQDQADSHVRGQPQDHPAGKQKTQKNKFFFLEIFIPECCWDFD